MERRMTTCRLCAHYRPAPDAGLARAHGKCTHTAGAGGWLPPATPGCLAFARRTLARAAFLPPLIAALLFDLILLPCLWRIIPATMQPAFFRLPLWSVATVMLLVGPVAPFSLFFVNARCLTQTVAAFQLERPWTKDLE